MKNIIFIFFIMFSGCFSCIKYPTILKDKKGNLQEPQSCIDYKICLYYVATGKLQSNCNKEFDKCCKDRDYIFCNDPGKRWQTDSPGNCWDKKQ